jgi:hypothetical protein
MYLLLFVVAAIGGGIYFYSQYEKDKLGDVVPAGSVAWDGVTAHLPGQPLPVSYQLIDIEERITSFGVDVLGLVSVIDTSSNETGYSTEEGYSEKGPLSKSVQSGKSGNSTVTTRQSTEFKYRYIIVWKPDLDRIRQFLKSGNIELKIAELLRTIPDLDMNQYAEILGITIVRWDSPKKRQYSISVELGDGVDIPY